jgi:hypothetical protein
MAQNYKTEDAMRKKIKTHKRGTSADTLLKTSKKKDIELTEKELGRVTGGKSVGWAHDDEAPKETVTFAYSTSSASR